MSNKVLKDYCTFIKESLKQICDENDSLVDQLSPVSNNNDYLTQQNEELNNKIEQDLEERGYIIKAGV
jgi:cell division protein FtsB